MMKSKNNISKLEMIKIWIYWSQTSGKKIEMIRIDYLDVYSVTNIAQVVIGYAQMVVCQTTNNTRTIRRLYRTTNKGDKGTQVQVQVNMWLIIATHNKVQGINRSNQSVNFQILELLTQLKSGRFCKTSKKFSKAFTRAS